MIEISNTEKEIVIRTIDYYSFFLGCFLNFRDSNKAECLLENMKASLDAAYEEASKYYEKRMMKNNE